LEFFFLELAIEKKLPFWASFAGFIVRVSPGGILRDVKSGF